MASIVDIHPHVIATDNQRYPLDPLGGVQSTWSRDRPTPYETMVAAMDAAGVAKAALVQASTAYGHDNSYVAAAIAAHPKRFTGVFSVDMLAPDAVEKMKHWIGLGFGGMRLFTTGSTMRGQANWFDDPRTFPAWEYAGKAGVPVCMQMTQQGLPQLRGLMDRFPDVKMILDHLARPQFVDGPPYGADAAFFDLARYSQVYLKLTPLNVTPAEWGKATPETFFGKLIQTFGANRIAWGSNFPATDDTLAGILGKAQSSLAFASADERAWIFGKTAQTLYPRLAD
ncbi:MAG TPA: amidohydrolase family protein [Xanthobacteraceae bacterium]